MVYVGLGRLDRLPAVGLAARWAQVRSTWIQAGVQNEGDDVGKVAPRRKLSCPSTFQNTGDISSANHIHRVTKVKGEVSSV